MFVLASDTREVVKVAFCMVGGCWFFVFHGTICNVSWATASIVGFDLVLSDLSGVLSAKKEYRMNRKKRKFHKIRQSQKQQQIADRKAKGREAWNCRFEF